MTQLILKKKNKNTLFYKQNIYVYTYIYMHLIVRYRYYGKSIRRVKIINNNLIFYNVYTYQGRDVVMKQ